MCITPYSPIRESRMPPATFASGGFACAKRVPLCRDLDQEHLVSYYEQIYPALLPAVSLH